MRPGRRKKPLSSGPGLMSGLERKVGSGSVEVVGRNCQGLQPCLDMAVVASGLDIAVALEVGIVDPASEGRIVVLESEVRIAAAVAPEAGTVAALASGVGNVAALASGVGTVVAPAFEVDTEFG